MKLPEWSIRAENPKSASDSSEYDFSPIKVPLLRDEETHTPLASPRTMSYIEETATPSSVDSDIFDMALPTLATLAADPLASLISTAWVGQIGAIEIAGVGVALSVYGAFTKLLNMPVLAIVTGSTASALGASNGNTRSHAVSKAISSSLLLALLVGILQGLLVLGLGVRGLSVWGADPSTLIYTPAYDYLTIRALGLPAGILMLSLQGAFRGLGDAKTPLLITILCNVINVVLEPTFIFGLGWGVRGAAAAVVTAQVASAAFLLYLLSQKIDFARIGGFAASLSDTVQYVKPTSLLAVRTAAVTAVYAVGTGLIARTDAVHAAAHQVAFQLWLASSLLADSLAVAAQALIARCLAAKTTATASTSNSLIEQQQEKDAESAPLPATTIASVQTQRGQLIVHRVNQLAICLGVALSLGLTVGSEVLHLPQLFSNDPAVLSILWILMPIVIATQPLNAMAFTLDGIAYGVNAYAYAAKAMVMSALPAIAVMVVGCNMVTSYDAKLLFVWAGLATVMLGRVLTLVLPLSKMKAPFDVLRGQQQYI